MVEPIKTKATMINDLNEISIESSEGRLLMAALAKLTSESQTDKTPNEVIGQLNLLADKMFVKEQQLPQQEISDEEIEKASEPITNIGNRRKYWQDGAKWYREQLKQRQ